MNVSSIASDHHPPYDIEAFFENPRAFELRTQSLGVVKFWTTSIENIFRDRRRAVLLMRGPTRDLMTHLASLIGTHLNQAPEPKRGIQIIQEEAETLTDDELEQFAGAVLEKRPDFYLLDPDAAEDIQPGNPNCIGYDKTDIPRDRGESLTRYLQRLLGDYESRRIGTMLTALEGFSQAATQKVIDNMRMSERIEEGLSSIKMRSAWVPAPILGDPIYETNRTLNEVVDAVGSLVEMNKGLTDVVVRIRRDSKGSAKKANRKAFLAIAIAFISLTIGIYSNYSLNKILVQQTTLLKGILGNSERNKGEHLNNMLAEQSKLIEELKNASSDPDSRKARMDRLLELISLIQKEVNSSNEPEK